MSFGHSNLKNLVKVAQEKGKKIVLVEETPIQKRDFTNGKAQLLFEELRNKGAKVVYDFGDALVTLKTLEKNDRRLD
jgi:hypothetical protein